MVFLKPAEILAAAIAVAKKKEEISWWKTFVAGFMGGLFTSMGILFAVRVGGGVPNAAPGAQRLYFGALAPTGMFMIVLTNAELWSASPMYATFSILAKDSSKPWHTLWRNLAKNHGFALLGNFAACVFASAFFGILTGFFDGDPNVFREWVIAMTVARCQNTEFFRLFFSGVLGAVYVCFATLMALAADDISSKMLACWWPMSALYASNVEHVVSNMVGKAVEDGGSRITVTRTNATHTVVSTAVGSVILFPEAGDVTNNLPQFTWAMQDRAIHKGERFLYMVGLMVGAETTFWHYLANLVAVSLGHVVGAVFLTALALYFIYGQLPPPCVSHPISKPISIELGVIGPALATSPAPAPSPAPPPTPDTAAMTSLASGTGLPGPAPRDRTCGVEPRGAAGGGPGTNSQASL